MADLKNWSIFSTFLSSDENFKQRKNEVFRHLKSLSPKEQYQKALSTMKDDSEKNIQAFCTIIETVLDLQTPLRTVRVFCLFTAKTYGAHLQILEQLNSQGSKVTATENLQQSDVVFLFCPVQSRISSDVETAVRKITGGAEAKPVVLILMSHTRDPDSVPNQTLWREKFPQVAYEVRVLYHQTKKGLLQCDLNEDAVLNLQTICRYITDTAQDASYETIGQQEIDDVREGQDDREHRTEDLEQPMSCPEALVSFLYSG